MRKVRGRAAEHFIQLVFKLQSPMNHATVGAAHDALHTECQLQIFGVVGVLAGMGWPAQCAISAGERISRGS